MADKLLNYHFEKFIDLHGRELDLPSLLKVSACSICKCLVVRRRITDWQLSAIRPYTRAGLIRYRNATPINGRPVCELCHMDWVQMNSARGTADATD